jgi:hypothetical protein
MDGNKEERLFQPLSSGLSQLPMFPPVRSVHSDCRSSSPRVPTRATSTSSYLPSTRSMLANSFSRVEVVWHVSEACQIRAGFTL